MALDIAGSVASGVTAGAALLGVDLPGMTKPTKAKLTVKPGDPDSPTDTSPLTCMFNPTEYSLSRTVNVQRNQSTATTGGTPQYSGSGPLSLTMQLFFDDFASPHGDVTPSVTRLLTWTVPKDPKKQNARPPKVGFDWGNTQLTGFWGYITSIRVNYTVFRMDGRPIQAKVDLTIEEVMPEQPPGTNPTSHAINSNRVRTVIEGETIHALAHRELGSPDLWRSIAELNGIDDPMSLPAGSALLMPTRADALKQR
jgi:nucleoid-associated protein YgaU